MFPTNTPLGVDGLLFMRRTGRLLVPVDETAPNDKIPKRPVSLAVIKVQEVVPVPAGTVLNTTSIRMVCPLLSFLDLFIQGALLVSIASTGLAV